MKVFRHWATATIEIDHDGERWPVRCYGWSDQSAADAERSAHERATRAATRFQQGDVPNWYHYGERPLREEVVETLGSEASPVAAVTRSATGCLVLNAAEACFADVDAPRGGGAAAVGGLIGRLFGRTPVSFEDRLRAAIAREVADHRHAARLYRTAAGYRVLFTDRPRDPVDRETQALLKRLGSDPLYVRLCREQACFRARLTPKPWRCGATRPPTSFPWDHDEAEIVFREWELAYADHSAAYATCQLVETFGDERPHPDIAPVLDLHDRLTLGEGPLA